MLDEKQIAEETRYREIVESAGAVYKGFWRVGWNLVLFDNSFGSTLALKPEDLTADNVRAKVLASDALFTPKVER